MDDVLRIYIGWDQREDEAYQVCKTSIVRRTSAPVHITPLKVNDLVYRGVYKRSWTRNQKGQRIDSRDGKPFSTDFSFSRFLVPALQGYRGWAVFVDCDFLFRADIAELFAYAEQGRDKACFVVQHRHDPKELYKMDGQEQTRYRRKNWSSLILWNCAHPAHRALTVEAVNEKPGSWLHGFEWLKDEEIGSLPVEWNWLEGWSPPDIKPKAVHYTRGGPWFDDYQNVEYAKDWTREKQIIEESVNDDGAGFFRVPFRHPPAKDAADD